MKVPTYTAQVQRTTEVGGQRMSVQASPQQFARGAEAAKAFYAQAEDAAFQYGKAELQQRNETERLKALNESNRMLAESAFAAEEIARNDPDAAEQYFKDSVAFHRDKQSQSIQNDATREQFFLQYDAASQKQTVQVQNYARSSRLRQGTAVWVDAEDILINKASKGDVGAMLELYGDPTKGIKSHYDKGVEMGYIAPDKAAGRSTTSRTLVAKNRLINHMDGLDTIEKLEEFSSALENGEVPPDISSELALLLPSEIKQLKGAIQTEIKSEQALKKAADALLSDEQRLEFEQAFADPDINFEMKKGMLLNLVMGTPEQFGLTSSDFRATQAYARGRIGDVQSTVNAAVRTIAKNQAAVEKMLTDGFDPGQDAILAIDREIAALGAAAPDDLVQSQLQLQRTYSTINAMRKMGPVELEQYISGMEQQFEGKMVPEVAAVIKNGRTMQSKLNTRIDNGDAIGAAQDRGLIDLPPLVPDMYERAPDGSVITTQNGMPIISNQYRDVIAQRKQAAAKVAEKFNLTKPQFLTATEQQVFKERLKFGDAGTRMAILTSVVTGFGAEAPTVLSEIADTKEVGVYGHIGGLIVDGRNEAAEDALRGITKLQEGGPVEGLTPTFINQEFYREIGDSFYGIEKAEGSFLETAKAIYAARYATMPYDPGNFRNALQAAAGRSKNGMGGIGDVRDKKIILPSNMTADDMGTALSSLTAEHLANINVSGQEIDPKMLSDIRTSDKYRIAPHPQSGSYFVYRGNLGQDDFKYITDVNGDPLLIDFVRWKERYGK